jgi:hypothetical protein
LRKNTKFKGFILTIFKNKNEIPFSKELSEMLNRYIFVRSSILTAGAEKERESEYMESMLQKERSSQFNADKFANVSGIRKMNGLFFNDNISKPLAVVNVVRIDSNFSSVSSTFSVMTRFCNPVRDDPGKLSEPIPLQLVIESRLTLGSEGRNLKD